MNVTDQVANDTVSTLCCTYTNGPVTFNLCAEDNSCPVLKGYSLVKSIPTPSCMVCTGSNKSQIDAQIQHKMRVK